MGGWGFGPHGGFRKRVVEVCTGYSTHFRPVETIDFIRVGVPLPMTKIFPQAVATKNYGETHTYLHSTYKKEPLELDKTRGPLNQNF